MVEVIIDGTKYSGKEIIIKNWNSHAKKDFTHFFCEEYNRADELSK